MTTNSDTKVLFSLQSDVSRNCTPAVWIAAIKEWANQENIPFNTSRYSIDERSIRNITCINTGAGIIFHR